MENAELVQLSFECIEDDLEGFVTLFYKRWFGIRPEMRAIFPDDLDAQSVHLARALAMLVKNADRLEELRPMLNKLGREHVDMGVEHDHIHSFADSLLQTFAHRLGDQWGELQASAWREVIGQTWAMMFEGAEPAL